MKPYVLSAVASADIRTIWRYIAADNIEAAGRIRSALLEACRFISRHPEAGHVREDLTKRPFRFWPVGSYLVIYDPHSKPVTIQRVLHGARDLKKLLR